MIAAAVSPGARRFLLSIYAHGLVHFTQGGVHFGRVHCALGGSPPWDTNGPVHMANGGVPPLLRGEPPPLLTSYLYFLFSGCCVQVAINYPQQALCSWSTAAGTVKGHLYGQVQPKTTRSASEAKVPANLQNTKFESSAKTHFLVFSWDLRLRCTTCSPK